MASFNLAQNLAFFMYLDHLLKINTTLNPSKKPRKGVDYMSHAWNCMFSGIDFHLFPRGKLCCNSKKNIRIGMSFLVGNSLSPTHVGASKFDVTRFLCHSSFVSTLQLQCLLPKFWGNFHVFWICLSNMVPTPIFYLHTPSFWCLISSHKSQIVSSDLPPISIINTKLFIPTIASKSEYHLTLSYSYYWLCITTYHLSDIDS
jgi:hypothetical protein